jgi:hypothetical protein
LLQSGKLGLKREMAAYVVQLGVVKVAVVVRLHEPLFEVVRAFAISSQDALHPKN